MKKKKSNIEKIYPLSPLQEGMLFHALKDPQSKAYYQQVEFTIEGNIDPHLLETALKLLVEKYDILRTRFIHEKIQKPRQVVLKETKPSFHFRDLTASPPPERRETIQDYKTADMDKGFNLSRDNLTRVALFKEDDRACTLIWSFHHIIMDGWCLGILFREVLDFYGALKAGQTPRPQPAVPYKRFIDWIQQQDQKQAAAFWRDYLRDFTRPSVLPRSAPGTDDTSYRQEIYYHQLSPQLTAQLEQTARARKVTVNTLFHAAWGLLLQRYNNSRDAVFGAVVSGRPAAIAGVEEMVGLFINTVPVRVTTAPGDTFDTLLEHLHPEWLELKSHEYLSLSQIQTNHPLRNHVITHLLAYENFPGVENPETVPQDEGTPPGQGPGFRVLKTSAFEQTNYDFNLQIAPGPSLRLKFFFNSRVHDMETVRRTAGHLQHLMEQAAAAPGTALDNLETVTPEEKKQVLQDFNDTAAPYPSGKSIPGLFAQQVERTPDRTALVSPPDEKHGHCRTVTLTYRQLDGITNAVAHRLIDAGIQPGDIVGLMLERSIEMIAGLLGILKAGAIYLPILPQYPAERIRYILADSNAKLLVTTSNELEPGIFSGNVFYLAPGSVSLPSHLGPITAAPPDAAYVIYTSGSTGRPKGVVVTHEGVANHLVAFGIALGYNLEDRVLQFADITFDASVSEVFTSLLTGAALHLADRGTITDHTRLTLYIQRRRITALILPPIVANHLDPGQLTSIRQLITAGSPPSVALAERWLEKTAYVNGYGPTEVTICTSFWRKEKARATGLGAQAENVPIGPPIANTRVFIVTHGMNLQPIGVPGELIAQSVGVAPGYLNRPGLTAETFIRLEKDPSGGPPGAPARGAPGGGSPWTPDWPSPSRLYKTGDLAKWLPDGNIEFLGRVDDQVKIRGFRIEPGEIEAQLLHHPNIEEAVVAAVEKEAGESYLRAYFVPAGGEPPSLSQLREFLSSRLPAYMVPAYFVLLDHMPLTPNGKPDRRALQDRQDHLTGGARYQAPQTAVQETLARVWQEVLGGERIGIEDNFFELGGDSITAIQVSGNLLKHGYKLEIKDLFLYPTVKQLAPFTRDIRDNHRLPDQGAVTGETPLTPIQRYFFQQQLTHPHRFNLSLMFYKKDRFDIRGLKEVFTRLVQHHDALRMIYPEKKGRVTQVHNGTGATLFHLDTFDITGEQEQNIQTRVTELSRDIAESLSISNGPPVRPGLIQTAEGDHLLVVIHHLVVDGISWRILLEDLETAYRQWEKGEPITLPPKTDSFQTWARKLEEYAQSHALLKQIPYWQDIAGRDTPSLPQPPGGDIDRQTAHISLDKTDTSRLLKESNRAYHTEINHLLLTALGMAVNRWAGLRHIRIDLEGHGREELFPGIDTSRTAGWFTSLFPILLDMTGPIDPGRRIKTIKETMRGIPDNGTGYGVLTHLTPPEKKPGFSPGTPARISFNYLGQLDGGVHPAGEERIFQVSPISPAAPDHQFGKQYALALNGMVTNGELQVTFGYNGHQYKVEDIRELAESYKSCLKELISHCVNREEPVRTPSDFSACDLDIQQLDTLMEELETTQSISPNHIEDIYALAPLQQGMLFHYLKEGEARSSAYVEQTVLALEGDLETGLLEKSFNLLVERYDILRTLFSYGKTGIPQQTVLKKRPVSIDVHDLSHLEQAERAAAVEAFKQQDRERGFDLKSGNLLRLSLFKTSPTQYTLVCTFHHIIMDGWCLWLLVKDLLHMYRALKNNLPVSLETPPPYSRYIRLLRQKDQEGGKQYWSTYLEGYETPTGLPRTVDEPPAQDSEYRSREIHLDLGRALSSNLEHMAGTAGVTLNTLFQTAWGLILQRYNTTRDALFGTVVSGRPPEIEGVENMVGLFINTVPTRVTVEKENRGQTFTAAAQKTAKGEALSMPYHWVQLADIQSASPLKNRLFDHIVAFENFPVQEEVGRLNRQEELGFAMTAQPGGRQTNYPLNVIIQPGPSIDILFQFNALVYEEPAVQRTAGHVKALLLQVTAHPGLPVRDIDILTPGEREKIINHFNRTDQPFPGDRTVCRLIGEQAERTPDAVAVRGPSIASAPLEGALTYRELLHRSRLLAEVLRKDTPIRPGEPVGLLLSPSLERTPAVLAVLLAGGCYVPLDPALPLPRIRYMIADAGVRTLMFEQAHAPQVEELDPQCPCLEYYLHIEDTLLSGGAHKDVPTPAGEEHLAPLNRSSRTPAYIVYTSGTTGNPKGVLVEHRSLVNYCCWHNRYYRITPADRTVLFSSFSFDGSVWDLFPYLLAGASVYVLPESVRLDVEALNAFFNRRHITVVFLTTRFGEQFLSQANHSLRLLQIGGSKLRYGPRRPYKLYNNYGPTETTVVVTACPVESAPADIPIGKPIDNTVMVILNPLDRRLQPTGVAGELYIGGSCLARGYLNRPELTAERFIHLNTGETMAAAPTLKSRPVPPPVGGPGGARHGRVLLSPWRSPRRGPRRAAGGIYYQTGDLACWTPDGNIRFLGRVDHQVKIRGFRIEPGEIEVQLLQHPGIKEAAVIAMTKESGETYLRAHVVPAPGQPPSLAQLREFLSSRLPGYMVPAYFVQMDRMPLNANGKPDRGVLQAQQEHLTGAAAFEAPRTGTQRILAQVWQEILGGESIGINDDFFELGGDSITAIQVSGNLLKHGLKLEIKDLFLTPTIKELAPLAQKLRHMPNQGAVTGEVPLTPIQHLFFDEKLTHPHRFCHFLLFYKQDRFDIEILREVFTRLVQHHDALRMVFPEKEGPVTQVNNGIEAPLFTLDTFDLTGEEDRDLQARVTELSRDIRHNLSITAGPLVKLGLFRAAAGDHLLLVIHHLVVDGVSWRLLLQDLETAYRQAKKGETITLPPKTDAFQTWARKLREYAQSGELIRQLPYWRDNAAREIPSIPAPPEGDILRRGVDAALDKTETSRLLKEANRAYNTEINHLLLTALGMALNRWAGLERVRIDLESHGREPITGGIDITRTVGWFTSLFPVILDMGGEPHPAERIISVKETLRNIPANGTGYGILTYLTPSEKKPGFSPGAPARISFNYLGQFDGGMNKGDEGLLFKVSPLSPGSGGDHQFGRQYALSVNAMVTGGEMQISFGYNGKQYEEEKIQELAELYKNSLTQLIHHCISQEQTTRTPSDFSACGLDNQQLEMLFEDLETPGSFKRTDVKDIYSLAPLQQGMLFHYLKEGESRSTAYFEQTVLALEGELDVSLLEKSFNQLVGRYDILRTVFSFGNIDTPQQTVLRERRARIDFRDISHLEKEEQTAAIESFKQRDREQGFQLKTGMPVRLSLFQTAPAEYTLVCAFHHIIMDGWCLWILVKDLLHMYRGLKNNAPVQLETPPPYSRYIRWLAQQDHDAGRRYWETYLEGFETPTGPPRPAGAPSPQETRYQSREVSLPLGRSLTQKLEHTARSSGVTLNTLFQTAWGLLLQRYNNTRDAVFGAVVSGRPYEVEEVENMVGLFINTVPVRITVQPGDTGPTFTALAQEVRRGEALSMPHHYVQLAHIQAAWGPDNPLFGHIVAFENFPVQEEVDRLNQPGELGFTMTPQPGNQQTNYHFNVIIQPGPSIHVLFRYNALVYGDGDVRRTAGHMKELLLQVTEHPDLPVGAAELLTAEERAEILDRFNQTRRPYPRDKSVCRLFEEQVDRTPDAAVLSGPSFVAAPGGGSFTYRELLYRARRLADALRRDKGIRPGEPTGILLSPTVERPLAVLAVLLAGGCYVPLDPALPVRRLRYMAADADIRFLLSAENHSSLLGELQAECTCLESYLCIDTFDFTAAEGEPLPPVNVPSGAPAYIIYTSGTTGRPKGVLVGHRTLVNLCRWHCRYYEITGWDHAVMYAGFGFDGSVWEMFPYLLAGASLYIPPETILLDIEALNDFFNSRFITAAFLPSQVCEQFMPLSNRSLRILLTGGEKLRGARPQTYKLYNNYGPTENTAITTAYPVESPSVNIPIGKPIDNTVIYILHSPTLRLQPIGAPGELYIGGSSLARGYLNRPELTAEYFTILPPPLIGGPGGARHGRVLLSPWRSPRRGPRRAHGATAAGGTRLYRSGDLARWLPDGNIEFLGRVDQQVKIRGFRIELAEIETQLTQLDSVKEAVVTAVEPPHQKTGDKYLCAYIVSTGAIDAPALENHLSRELPAFMIPAFFIPLDTIPLNPSGKVDRGALPVPAFSDLAPPAAPSGPVEELLVSLWARVLHLEEQHIGADSDFFALGGHSLKAMQLVSNIHKHLEVKIALAQLFQTPTIRGLARHITGQDKEHFTALEPVEKKEYYPPAPAQLSIYIQQQKDKQKTGYNMSQLLRVEGVMEKDRVEEAYRRLIQRHESLRTSFLVVGDEPMQRIHEEVPFQLEYYEETPERADAIAKNFTRPFDLARAPLLRAGLVKLEEQHYIWMFDMHHTIYDGASAAILIKEFFHLYKGGPPLPPLGLQYKDFAQWFSGPRGQELLRRQREFWHQQLAAPLPRVNLPLDHPRPKLRASAGANLQFRVETGPTGELQALATEEKATMFILLQAVYAVLLAKLTRQEDILVGTPVAARKHADLQSIIGMFVNLVPLRTFPVETKTFREFLRETRDHILQAFEHQEYPNDTLITELPIKRLPGRHPLFDVYFSLENIPFSDIGPTGFSVTAYPRDRTGGSGDLKFNIRERSDSIQVSVSYASELLEKETVEKFTGYYLEIIQQVTADPSTLIKNITLSHDLLEADTAATESLQDDWEL